MPRRPGVKYGSNGGGGSYRNYNNRSRVSGPPAPTVEMAGGGGELSGFSVNNNFGRHAA